MRMATQTVPVTMNVNLGSMTIEEKLSLLSNGDKAYLLMHIDKVLSDNTVKKRLYKGKVTNEKL